VLASAAKVVSPTLRAVYATGRGIRCRQTTWPRRPACRRRYIRLNQQRRAHVVVYSARRL